MKDLAGWERQQRQSFVPHSLPSAPSTSTAGSATEVLTSEAKTTQWGIVTEYVRPLSGPSYFQGPDGNIHDGSEGLYYYRRMPRSPHLCWYFIACRYCRRFAVTFPDNGGINYTYGFCCAKERSPGLTGLSKQGHKDLNCGCTYLCVVAVFVTIVTKSHDPSKYDLGIQTPTVLWAIPYDLGVISQSVVGYGAGKV